MSSSPSRIQAPLDGSGIINRVTVYGKAQSVGTTSSIGYYEDNFTANGTQTIFQLSHLKLYRMRYVYLNGVATSFTTDWITEPGDAIYINYVASTVVFQTAPANGVAVQIVYWYSDTVSVSSHVSVTRDVTDLGWAAPNMWFDYEFTDESLTTVEEATAAADAILLQYGQPNVIGTLITNKLGLEPSQQISITDPVLALAGNYTIRRCTITLDPAGTGIINTVQFGGRPTKFSDLFNKTSGSIRVSTYAGAAPTTAPTTAPVIVEGPGISIVGNTIGLGGDTVLLFDSGGAALAEYAATAAGVDAALAAATSGDVVWLPAGTIAGNHTVPAGVEVTGAGVEKSILSGTITNNGSLSHLQVSGTLTNSGALNYIIDPLGYTRTTRNLGLGISPRTLLHVDSAGAGAEARLSSPAANDATVQFYSRNGADYEGWALLKHRTDGNFELHRDNVEAVEAATAFHVYKSNAQTAFDAGLSGSADDVLRTGLFLVAAFREDDTPKLYLATSGDGLTWQSLAGGALYTAPSGVLRDPSLVFYGEKFWVAYTNDATPQFTVLSSLDLLTWSKIADVSMTGVANANHVWAPEWFIDPVTGDIHVFCAVSTTGAPGTFQIYEVHPTNAAMTTWSVPAAVTGTSLPADIIDPFMVYHDGLYHLWFKDDTTKYLCYASSATLTSGYTVTQSGNWAGWGDGLEGASVVQVASGRWRIYFDDYVAIGTPGNGIYYSESTDDWATWSTKVLTAMPFTFNHCTVFVAAENAGLVGLQSLITPNSDHGGLTGLADDDHTQYLNNVRHDVVARHAPATLGTGTPSASNYLRGDGAWSTVINGLEPLTDGNSNFIVANGDVIMG